MFPAYHQPWAMGMHPSWQVHLDVDSLRRTEQYYLSYVPTYNLFFKVIYPV